MKKLVIMSIIMASHAAIAQERMTPELLWGLGRVSGELVSDNGESILYGVTHYNIEENKSNKKLYRIPFSGGPAVELNGEEGAKSAIAVDDASGKITYLYKGQIWVMNSDGGSKSQLTSSESELSNLRISPDGKHILFSKEVLISKVHSPDRYPELKKSNAYVFDDLNYRHWDTWEDGKYQHIFVADYAEGKIGSPVDIMPNEPHDCPQMPFGGSEDAIWSPDSKSIVYVSKKKVGKEYAQSTNTDLYLYSIAAGNTVNLTPNLKGYDTSPEFNKAGSKISWLSMSEDGNESDKNDLLVYDFKSKSTVNVTKDWDGTVASFKWDQKGTKIYFLAAIKGTEQLFEISKVDAASAKSLKQVTKGQFDITSIIGQSGNQLVLSKEDMNHASELFKLNLKTGLLAAVTTVNKAVYDKLAMGKITERTIRTSDNKDMLAWVIYPPDFDPSKKYPTLLYCQGGPQSALSQFYSFRWNFQLMAANGYIIIAPNRRGMPGYGVEWNKQISGDWGGQPMRDYLAAIDDIAKEPYVDKDRLGAVGASYGGYSVYMLAGIHEKRFKTFIAHDGLFDLRSWYGTTEELWFANKDIGGPYWGANVPEGYKTFSPIEYAGKWNTPIMIVQGGKDYRVPIEQGLEAFQLAQLKGIKSRLLYLPDENHWVVSAQNALVWQTEFFKWLKETL
ncbi:Prolyl oligopeptidase family protein [Arcticibacter svalbardensis MN12-7]|uniref:Prolyl oligopeptidase family protein n=1 Tax=Arcticibacter svalbardensis MN12-7 TaxID=1150600 RepID=R9GPF0_9SPHI|nr:S9 family peptidase [Arcticibacter svalbardensis]EOR93697.1 Prolyl oligopeptidase family protein [Arcticibacter svalbardensis MN12-7]